MKRINQLKLRRSLLAALTAGGLISSVNAADPVITDPLKTSIGVVTGGDPGEGLDLEGDFPYALSMGAEPDFTAKIGDATFFGLIDAEVPGASLIAGNRILNWYVVNYGDSANDEALKAATSSIRWSAANSADVPEVVLTLENLQIGTEYKFQMTFGEQCCNRGFDVLFDDQLVVKDFNPGVVHGGIANGTQEALITHVYTPKASTVVLRFDGREASPEYSDHNAILNAVIVEKLGLALDTDNDGMPDDYENKYGFNPNDPSDAAKDFDGDGVSNLDEFKAGTNPTDTVKPVLNSAKGTATYNTVVLNFSEALDPVSAQNLANYSISPSLAITAASYAKNAVTLTTAPQTPGASAYTVTVNSVLDTSKNAVTANSMALFYSYLSVRTGVLKFSFWGGIPGNPVVNLTDDPRYPASPDWIGAVFSFNSRDILPTNVNENYGASMEGYVTPTESGNYDFFLRSDDASEVYVSTDDNPANLALQAYEEDCCDGYYEPGLDPATTAAPIALTAGKKYFVRLLYKEGGGGDYGQLAWRKTTDTTPAGSLTPIPGRFLSSAVDLPAPPEGAFLTQTPAANAKSVSPATAVTIVHRDGKTEWTSANVSLKFDGNAVTPVISKDANVITIKYVPPALLASASTHTVTLGYLDAGGQAATLEWSFTTFAYKGPTKDKVGNYPGLVAGSAVFTADAGGHTGKAGDTAINLTLKGGPVVTFSSAFTAAVNAATANDELTVSFWQKKLDIADSSAFTINSPSSGSGRGFHAHVPWSNQNIYFDTVGCCDGTTQRISAGIDTFPSYTGDAGFWTNEWHHFVFTKKGSAKNIWIDGQQFLTGDSTNPLPTDVDAFYMGSGGFGAELSHAIIDDFSVYGKELSGADALALFQGTVPTALPAAKGLLGYWDYNDAGAVTVPTLGISGSIITYTGVLQSSTTLNGTFAPVAGATSPHTVPAAATGAIFYRSAQ